MLVPRARLALTWMAALVGCAGCAGGDGQPRERVSGAVSLDGKPLEAGSISFMPIDAAGARTATEGAIAAGSYEIPADRGPAPGNYRVIISAPVADSGAAAAKKAAPKGADSVSGTGAEPPQEAPLRESVPAKYNAQTTLKAEVTKGGKNVFDFPLTTTP